MTAMMKKLREHPPQQINDKRVLVIEDYLKRTHKDLAKNLTQPLTLPVSDVLLFRLDGGQKLIVRPSGTEPKVKLYGSVALPPQPKNLDEDIRHADEMLKQLLASGEKDLKG